MSESRFRLPLVIGALALAQCFCWGMTFNLPAITGRAMAEALGLPYAAVMGGPTVMLVVMALAAVPFLKLFERLGARPIMTTSVIVGALGLVAVAASTAPWAYFAGWLLVGIAGAGMLTTAVQIGLAELAGRRAKNAIAALLVFGGLSSTICWPLLGALQTAVGWRMATLIGAGLMLTVGAPIYWLLLAKRSAGAARRKAEVGPVLSLDRTAFTLLAFSTAANGFVTWGFSLTIITLFEGRGIDHATAVLIASFIGLMQFPARLFNFAGGRWLGGLGVALLAGAGLPVSFVLLAFGAGTPAAIVFVVVYGLAGGIMAVARATMPLDLFPAAAYARASSMLALPLNLSFAVAPPVFAAILSGPGSEVALWVATGLSLAALAALTLLVLRHLARPAIAT
ncbi:MAG: MFS transporter [Devosia sp.]|nr:MFS transporter [Devosia sp.]